MAQFMLDFGVVGLLIIGLTALNGVIANGIGENLFGGKDRNRYPDASDRVQTNWKMVGGNNKTGRIR